MNSVGPSCSIFDNFSHKTRKTTGDLPTFLKSGGWKTESWNDKQIDILKR